MSPVGAIRPRPRPVPTQGGGPRERGLRTRCGTGAASMGSTAAVHRSEYCGVALLRLSRSKNHVELERENASSAASPPQTYSALANLWIGLFRSVYDLPYLACSNVRLGSSSVPLGSGLNMRMGANLDLWVRGVAHALFRRAAMGAFGTDEDRASGDPIRAAS